MDALLVSIGAVAGANARYFAGLGLARLLGGALPWATLVINVGGSLVLGALMAASMRRGLGEAWVLLLGVGFCGAYTTFSTFSVELLTRLQAGEAGAALAYTALSVALGLGAAAVGWWSVGRLPG